MSQRYCILLLMLLFSFKLRAQTQSDGFRHMLRVSDDNDIFKLLGDVSDKGYTNGTSIDYYYIKKHTSRFFLDKIMSKAGTDALNTFGLSLTQLMFTPSDLKTTTPDIADWPYSGALYLTHSLQSVNKAKKYYISTEILGGVMGKAALTKQMQTFIHTIIASDKPEGWGNGYPTDVLLNLKVEYGRQLWSFHDWIQVSGAANAMLGTMMDGASVYGYVRVGKMLPYLDGLISNFGQPLHQKGHFQFYIFARPSLNWVAYDAILDGGVFNGKSDYYNQDGAIDINHSITRGLDYGAVLGFANVSVSFCQKTMPRLVDGIKHQRIGNVSLQVCF